MRLPEMQFKFKQSPRRGAMKHSLGSRLSRIFPSHCTLCGDPVFGTGKSLCQSCQQQLPWLTQGCRYCGLPISDSSPASSICGQCQQSPPPFHSSHCLFRYAYPIDRLISQLKFNHQLAIGQLFGRLLAASVTARIPVGALPEAIIPMPLHRRRLRQRGFNQAYEIANLCADSLQIPLQHGCCRRIKDTPPQLGLDANTRRRNLRNAFSVEPMAYRSVAIVDDVMTTGCTADELARVLKRAGASLVEVWVVARAV